MSWDKIWNNVFQTQKWGKYPSESVIRFVARNFYKENRRRCKILEVGCGTGANLWYLAREGFDVYGIDGSEAAIKKAKLRLRNDGLQVNLKVGDIENLPYADEYFDGIIDNECLAHNSFLNAEKILREIKRVLKVEGLFYSKTFSNKVYLGNIKRPRNKLEFNNLPEWPFKDRGFVRLTDRTGIKRLYGKNFEIISLDNSAFTDCNRARKVSEWIIICKNRKKPE